MTNGVPDTGLIEAFKPLKTGGGGDRPKPSCSNCPCGLAEGTGLLCTRYPPEFTMYPVPQVGFKPVHKNMVCWEHPEMQAKMKRAVAAIESREMNSALGRFSQAGLPSLDIAAIDRERRRPGDPGVPVHAVGDDQRKPGDEST